MASVSPHAGPLSGGVAPLVETRSQAQRPGRASRGDEGMAGRPARPSRRGATTRGAWTSCGATTASGSSRGRSRGRSVVLAGAGRGRRRGCHPGRLVLTAPEDGAAQSFSRSRAVEGPQWAAVPDGRTGPLPSRSGRGGPTTASPGGRASRRDGRRGLGRSLALPKTPSPKSDGRLAGRTSLPTSRREGARSEPRPPGIAQGDLASGSSSPGGNRGG